MYNLIDTYCIPTTPEDLVVFATLQPSMNSLRDVICDALAVRDSSMEKFSSSLIMDIKKLQNEVTKIKDNLQVPVEVVF